MRTCDRCGSRMSPFFPRKRSGDELVCNGCKEIEERMMAQADIDKTANLERAIQQIKAQTNHRALIEALDQNQRLRELGVGPEHLPILDAQDEAIKERLSELGTKQGVEAWPGGPRAYEGRKGVHQDKVHLDLGLGAAALAKLGTDLRKFAHDSGDGETIYHCPFCGAGQVISRSDGTAQCQFCDTAFTVQVQPSMKSVPQTIDGEPHVHPDMPGSEPGTVPEEEEPDDQGEEMDLEPSEEEDQRPNPFTTGSRNGARTGYYITDNGDVLAYESYIQHLAINHADDRDAVIEAVKRSREQ